MKNFLFVLTVIISILFQPAPAEAVSKQFILKHINECVEIVSSTIELRGIERIVLREYNEAENLCLVEIFYRAGMGRENLAIQIRKYWINPDMIIFSPEKK